MNKNPFTVKQVEWAEYIDTLRSIRTAVFIIEQNVPRELEWDDKDEQAFHVLATSQDGTPVGTGRLLRSGQIGRMAVLREYRGQGAGSAIMEKLLQIAESSIRGQLFLNSQIDACRFYKQFGFVEEGETFMEAGIQHVKMIQGGND